MAGLNVAVRGWTHARGERAFVASLALIAVTAILAACGSSDTTSPGTGHEVAGVPQAWTFAPTNANSEVGIENISVHSGSWAAYMHGSGIGSGGTLSQLISAEQYRGKRIQVSAWVNESYTLQDAWFGAVLDTSSQWLQTYVVIPAPTSGVDTWHQVSVVLDVPNSGIALHVFGELFGTGQLFLDDIGIAVVDSTVPTTTMTRVPPPDSATLFQLSIAPQALLNAGFESGQ